MNSELPVAFGGGVVAEVLVDPGAVSAAHVMVRIDLDCSGGAVDGPLLFWKIGARVLGWIRLLQPLGWQVPRRGAAKCAVGRRE